MLSWLIPSIIGSAALAWAIIQHFHPRILCRLHYIVTDVSLDHHLTFGMVCGGGVDGGHHEMEIHDDLVGKCIEIRSIGNVSAKGILVHIRLKYPVSYWKIETDESHGEPYGTTGEFNLKMDNLNPTDVLRVLVYCLKEQVQCNEEILEEHRISLQEGKAKLVRKW